MDRTVLLWTPPEERDRLPTALPRPTTDAELKAAIRHYLGVELPDTVVVPGHSTPFRAVADAFFARSAVSIWYGARALAGKTYALAVLGWLEAALLQASVSILGGSQDQSERTHEYMHGFWNRPHVPPEIIDGQPGTTRTRLIYGNQIKALAASQRQARGGHPERLRLDEVDDLDWNVFQAVLGQPMSRGDVQSQTVICSTMQNPGGTMSKALALAAERAWPIYTWGYQETLQPHGWLSHAQVERKRSEMTSESWRVEVELGEPDVAGRAIDPAKTERMFVGPLLQAGGIECAYREFEAPVAGATYATGADWARTRDFVAIATLRTDLAPMRVVAYQRFRKKPVQYILAQFAHQTGRYPGAAAHDATSTGGLFMEDLIEVRPETTVDGFQMQSGPRRQLFTDYVITVEREDVVCPRLDLLYNSHRLCMNDDLFGTGHPPDDVVACALAVKASGRLVRPLRLENSQPARVAPPSALSPLDAFLARPRGNGHA